MAGGGTTKMLAMTEVGSLLVAIRYTVAVQERKDFVRASADLP
jgi:hypothetical protein